jgi:hypothetical protein
MSNHRAATNDRAAYSLLAENLEAQGTDVLGVKEESS